jgi:hypothetical protein
MAIADTHPAQWDLRPLRSGVSKAAVSARLLGRLCCHRFILSEKGKLESHMVLHGVLS